MDGNFLAWKKHLEDTSEILLSEMLYFLCLGVGEEAAPFENCFS